MSKHDYSESRPKEYGFYKVYDDNGNCFVAYYEYSGFRCGPHLNGVWIRNMKDDQVMFWEVWK